MPESALQRRRQDWRARLGLGLLADAKYFREPVHGRTMTCKKHGHKSESAHKNRHTTTGLRGDC